MNPRIAVLASLGVAALLVSGLALQGSYEWTAEQKVQKAPRGQKPQNRADGQTRKPRKADRLIPPGPGRHLAFDMLPADHKKTTGYVLEVTHPSGELTTHDLKKPDLQKRTILVPIPALKPGKYKLVVIADGPTGPRRSKSLDLEIPGGS